AAVLEVIELVQRIDAANERDAFEAAIGCHDLGDQPLSRLDLAMQAADRHLLVAAQTERLPGCAFLETERQHAMPMRFERWMRSNDCVITARTPRRPGPLAAQSREDPLPYSFPAN